MAAVQKQTTTENVVRKTPSKKRSDVGNYIYAFTMIIYICALVYETLIKKSSGETFLLNIEKDFRGVPWSEWTLDNLPAVVVVSFVYLAVVFLGPSLIPPQNGRPIKMALILWNVSLTVFSIWGSFRIVPWFVNSVVNDGFFHVMCSEGPTKCNKNTVACLWLMLFCLSKIPEMIDTLFLVARGRPVILLHWYHHITVAWYCIISWGTLSVSGSSYAAMNLTVHSFMYTYYSLAACGIRPYWFANSITICQIAQMFMGCLIAGYIYITPNCQNHWTVQVSGLIMYASYLALFAKFFYDRNFSKNASISKKKRL